MGPGTNENGIKSHILDLPQNDPKITSMTWIPGEYPYLRSWSRFWDFWKILTKTWTPDLETTNPSSYAENSIYSSSTSKRQHFRFFRDLVKFWNFFGVPWDLGSDRVFTWKDLENALFGLEPWVFGLRWGRGVRWIALEESYHFPISLGWGQGVLAELCPKKSFRPPFKSNRMAKNSHLEKSQVHKNKGLFLEVHNS